MSIDPGDQSEEVHLSMTINRHQTGNNTRERAVKVPLHFTQKPRTPRNKQPDAATAGTSMDLHTRDPRHSQERARAHTTHRRVSPFPAFLFSYFFHLLFHLCNLSTGALYKQRYRYRNPLTKKIPIFFHLHHSCIRPTPSQTCRNYFLIHKNPGPFNYRHTSISRHYHMYTIVQSRIILSHQKPCKPV